MDGNQAAESDKLLFTRSLVVEIRHRRAILVGSVFVFSSKS